MENLDTSDEGSTGPSESSEALGSQGLKGPVFVVGNGRSGTSVTLSTVRKTLGWKYHGEGHFYPVLREMMLASDRYFRSSRIERLAANEGHFVHHVKSSRIKFQLADIIRSTYDEVYGTTQFVDKTPGPQAILSLPFLVRAFPDMRIIHMKRRGIEVLRSSRKKFADTPFEDHIQIWKKALENWERVMPKLACPHITIDQHILSTQPEVVTAELSQFLQLSEAQSEAMLGYFTEDRPQSSGDLNRGGVSLAASGWTDEEIALFRAEAGELMRRHGWSEDEAYFAA